VKILAHSASVEPNTSMMITHRIESAVRWGVIALGLYLAGACVAVYMQISNLREAQRSVEHTQDVRDSLQDILSLVLEAESTQRGFVINKTPDFLLAHNSAIAKLRTALSDVATLTRDNPTQIPRAIALSRLVETKISQFKAIIDYVQGVDMVTAAENRKSGATRSVAGDIRVAIDSMLQEEDRLLDERNADVDTASRITLATFISLLVLFGAVGVAYFIYSNRNLKIRNTMLAELSDAKMKAERDDKFKGDLLSYLGRALHRPLTHMTYHTDLLLYRANNALSPNDQQIVTEIRAMVRFLLSLATNFLHIGRMQAGKPLVLDEDDCDLLEILQDALAVFKEASGKAGVSLNITTHFTRALIRCDIQKTRQILLNLLDNAVRNTTSGGRVDVSSEQKPDGSIVVIIQDAGPGIPAERLEQAMLPFVKIDDIFEREEKGIGLGLPMALGFAQAQGGNLEITSDQNGTTAILTIPENRIIRAFAAPGTR